MKSAHHVIRFEGHVDVSRYPEFRTAFESVPRGVPVLLDLSGAESVDSTFLTEMLMLRRRHGAKLVVLIPPAGSLARVFEIAELGTKMDVYADRASATRALST